jgi:Glycosyltransferase family 87
MREASRPQLRRAGAYLLLAAAAAVLTSLFLTKNSDFRVYWYGAKGFWAGVVPAYGTKSGIGFPMHYRYPPVTYLLFWPLTRMSLAAAGTVWMLGAWAAAILAVRAAVRKMELRFTRAAILAACAYLLPYVVLAIRYGNVQPYVIAMILAALALSESRRTAAGGLMALAITFKVWPLFFLPWFLRRGRRAVLAWLAAAMTVLWLAPLMVWTPAHYFDLTSQWYWSEVQNTTSNSENWYFPGQSLRGVLLRYLTVEEPVAGGFPDVHILSVEPEDVVAAWEAIAALTYAAACIMMLRADAGRRWIWDGLSFALFTILQPFCLKSGMISLGPAVLVAAAYSRARPAVARGLFLGGCGISLLAGVAQYKPLLRALSAAGMDFWAALLLLAALVLWARRKGVT